MELVAQEDRALYSSLLFLPKIIRDDVACLYAFHFEISRIPFLVSEPVPGEIRLQWWRDALSGERDDEALANPLAAKLIDLIAQKALPVEGFIRYLDARIFDLYNDPMPDRNTLEAYLGETESFMLQMSVLCAGGEMNNVLADSCGHSGVAIGISNFVSRLSYDNKRQRVYLPGDLLAATGLDAKSWLSDTNTGKQQALSGFISLGREHLEYAKISIRQLPKNLQSLFIPLVLAQANLDQAENSLTIMDSPAGISSIRAQLIMWKAALFGI